MAKFAMKNTLMKSIMISKFALVQSFVCRGMTSQQFIQIVSAPFAIKNIMNPCRKSNYFRMRLHASISQPTHPKVCVVLPENKLHIDVGYDIANKLNVPIFNYEESERNLEIIESYDNLINILPYQCNSIDTYAIAIKPMNEKPNLKRKNKKSRVLQSMQPFFIDFCPLKNSKLGQRLGKQHGGEKLLKAVAPNKFGTNDKGAIVFDLNAGFGQDSMIIAGGGASEVHMVERDPIVGLLLEDAIRRLNIIACLDPNKNEIEFCDEIMRARRLNDQLFLHQNDSIEFCKSLGRQHKSNEKVLFFDVPIPDVCYLDPMFPPRTKSSAVKKNMQILHGLFQNDDRNQSRIQEEQNLLKESLMLAKKRVVVKRPISAHPLGISSDMLDEGIIKPSYDIKGSINRFDVYVLS